MEIHVILCGYFVTCIFINFSGTISLGSGATNGFIKANSDAEGFYRVNYDISNWKKIIDYLNNSDFMSAVREQRQRVGG